MVSKTTTGDMNTFATFRLRGQLGFIQAYLKTDTVYEQLESGDRIDNIERLKCTTHINTAITTKHLVTIRDKTYSINYVAHDEPYTMLEIHRTI